MKSLREELEDKISDIVLNTDYQEPSMIMNLEGDLQNSVNDVLDIWLVKVKREIDDLHLVDVEGMIHINDVLMVIDKDRMVIDKERVLK